MFDLLGWDWTYEPFDYDGYIPDFLLHGGRETLVEVKGVSTLAELTPVVDHVHMHAPRWEGGVLAVGARVGFYDEASIRGTQHLVLGAMSDPWGCMGTGPALWSGCSGYDTEEKILNKAGEVVGVTYTPGCFPGIGFFHGAEGSYEMHPCGHWDGDHCIVSGHPNPSEEVLLLAWGKAHEMTRWTPESGAPPVRCCNREDRPIVEHCSDCPKYRLWWSG
jgi:hypothetical protein